MPLGFVVDYKFKGDFTGVHIASCNGHLKCIEVLLKYEASADKQDAGTFITFSLFKMNKRVLN